MARPRTAEAPRPSAAESLKRHRQLVGELVATGRAFVAAHAELAEFRGPFCAASGIGLEPPLQDFNIRHATVALVHSDVEQLAQLAASYMKGR